jgi:hypothetical protein
MTQLNYVYWYRLIQFSSKNYVVTERKLIYSIADASFSFIKLISDTTQ